MWSIFHDSLGTIAWFRRKQDALTALQGFNYHHRVVWDPDARIVAS